MKWEGPTSNGDAEGKEGRREGTNGEEKGVPPPQCHNFVDCLDVDGAHVFLLFVCFNCLRVYVFIYHIICTVLPSWRIKI